MCYGELENSQLKYARVVKRKVCSVEENGERDCGDVLVRFAGLTLSHRIGASCVLKNDFENKKPTVLLSMVETRNDSLRC